MVPDIGGSRFKLTKVSAFVGLTLDAVQCSTEKKGVVKAKNSRVGDLQRLRKAPCMIVIPSEPRPKWRDGVPPGSKASPGLGFSEDSS